MKRDDYISGTWAKPQPGEVDQLPEDIEPGHSYYNLVGRKVYPVLEDSIEAVLEWAKNFETKDRQVARTYVGENYVSTVFMGINHSFSDGPPKLFETMIFIDGEDDEAWRTTTYAKAEEKHKEAVRILQGD